VESSPGTIIKCILVISEQLYKGETYAQYPSEETNKVIIQVKNEKDMNINLHIKVLVGLSFFSKDFQVFEYNKIIPKYCFYILLRDDVSQYKIQYKQGISFKINERLERLLIWLQDNFNIPIKELSLFKNSENVYDIRFMSLRTDKVLQISMQNTTIRIMTDEIDLAGNILQDLCKFFQISELDTSIGYPDVVEETSSLLMRIEKLDSVRNQFNINMTEIITFIKDIFVRAEDNRLLDNMQGFKDYFFKINVRNLELLDEFEKRTQTYDELLKDLKKINNYIQYFANLKGKMSLSINNSWFI
jgi:Bardet-Biedl syndrome 2 protein